MSVTDFEKIKLSQKLSLLSATKLKKVNTFVDSLLVDSKISKEEKNDTILEGIWEGLGFEKIENLDEEISSLRKELDGQILAKRI